MPTLIGICGGSAAGKTLLCAHLKDLLGDEASVLSQDSYYRDIGPLSTEERLKVNFDCPDAIDEEHFLQDLKRLRNGESIRVPTYDYASCSRTGHSRPQAPTHIILVEGLFLLTLEEIRRALDHTFFVDCPDEVRVRRILRRDLNERGKTYDVAWTNIQTFVLPMHRKHIDPYKKFAEKIFANDGDDTSALREAAQNIVRLIQAGT
ncbi:MAG: uridine kinase [Pseudomonadota bacterium]